MPDAQGLLVPGNIDLHHRPIVKNADGTISTVRSIGVNIDGKEVLIPTVSDDGQILSNSDAVAQYLRTGKHLGMFDSPTHATTYAQRLHEDQAKEYGSKTMPDRMAFGKKLLADDPNISDADLEAALKVYDKQHALPTLPVSAEDFMKPEDIRNRDDSSRTWAQTLGNVAIGGAKGLGSTAVGIGRMAADAGLVPGVRGGLIESALGYPGMGHPVFDRADEATTATNMPQRVGKLGELATEVALPAARLATAFPGVLRMAAKEAVPLARDMANRGVVGAIRGRLLTKAGDVLENVAAKAGKATTPAAESGPVRLRLAQEPDAAKMRFGAESPAAAPVAEPAPARLRFGQESEPSRMRFGYEAPPPAAPIPPPPSPNAGGRLIKDVPGTAEEEMATMLQDVQQQLGARPPAARITTPPEPNLPAGYTPRTSAPKPKAPVAAKAAAPEATAATQPKRAYFLKPATATPASAPVEPLGRPVTMEDLPASWRPRVDQPIAGATGKAGQQLGLNAVSELEQRGVSLPEAIDAVAKNPALTPKDRLNLQSALVAMLTGGGQ